MFNIVHHCRGEYGALGAHSLCSLLISTLFALITTIIVILFIEQSNTQLLIDNIQCTSYFIC